MFIQTEATPNPEVLKFLPGQAVLGEGTRDFRSAEEAAATTLRLKSSDSASLNSKSISARFLSEWGPTVSSNLPSDGAGAVAV